MPKCSVTGQCAHPSTLARLGTASTCVSPDLETQSPLLCSLGQCLVEHFCGEVWDFYTAAEYCKSLSACLTLPPSYICFPYLLHCLKETFLFPYIFPLSVINADYAWISRICLSVLDQLQYPSAAGENHRCGNSDW